MTAIRKQVRRGFTLVEILIVVIILGILAAIVIPQFTNASEDARKSNMTSQLQTLRSQVELFKLQHRDDAPPLATFWDYMTQYSTDDIGDAPVAAATATASRRAASTFVRGVFSSSSDASACARSPICT